MFAVFASLFVSGIIAYPTKYYGVDVSAAYHDKSTWNCLLSENLTFAIVRVYESVGHVDPNAVATLKAANDAGVKTSGYIFPCARCSNANGTAQVIETIDHLRSNGAPFSMLWFDVEEAKYWHADTAFNFNFFKEMIRGAELKQVTWGIYCDVVQWQAVMGSHVMSGTSNIAVWYPHYNGVPSMSDFKAFAGFTHCDMKQFSDQGAKCGASYDINWTPNPPL
jgi:hypothetical protein